MADQNAAAAQDVGETPRDYVPGLIQNAKFDIMAGFILFLVALPLSLAIAAASGVPAVAGLITAIVGGIIGGFIGGSYVTINGPAAGLIVIVLGCFNAMLDLSGGDPNLAYQYLLAVGVAAGAIQVILGICRAGPMTNVFPFSVVEGMIAGIGIIIMVKQLYVAIGVKAEGKMAQHFMDLPAAFGSMVPQAAIIGLIAVLMMIYWPKDRGPASPSSCRRPLAIMIVTIPLAAFFNAGLEEPVISLVKVPTEFSAIMTYPNFDQIFHTASILFIVTFVMVGSLESLLTAVAIEKKDPWKRRNDMNRELWSKGIANSAAAFIGGIPMIAEVVRSSTNIMVGARTRWANIFHGSFILIFLVALPFVLNMIPLAALAGMLIVIGFRLAHPNIFKHIAETGADELVFMIATVLGVVFVDLLFGVFCGMWLAIALNAIRAGSANRFGSAAVMLLVHLAFAGGRGLPVPLHEGHEALRHHPDDRERDPWRCGLPDQHVDDGERGQRDDQVHRSRRVHLDDLDPQPDGQVARGQNRPAGYERGRAGRPHRAREAQGCGGRLRARHRRHDHCDGHRTSQGDKQPRTGNARLGVALQ